MWNEEGISVRLIIQPPFWQTIWFRWLGFIAVISTAGFIFQRKLSGIRKEKKTKEDFTRQLIDSHELERKKISRELHDSLGQDLVIIKNNANMALNKLDNRPEASKYIRQISDISTSSLVNVRAISHNLRPVELKDKLGLTETVKSLVDLVSSSSTINFSSDIDIIENVFDKNNEVNYCRIIQAIPR